MKISNYNHFINEQQQVTEEQTIAIIDQTLAQVAMFEEHVGEEDFMEYIDDLVEQLEKSNDMPEVVKAQTINSIILMKDANYREICKKALTLTKERLVSGLKLAQVNEDPEVKALGVELESEMTRILKKDKEDVANTMKKYFKGASKYKQIRDEEASRVTATPEDPYGEESWDNAMSEEDAIKKAFAQDEEN